MPDWMIMTIIIIVIAFLMVMNTTAMKMGLRCEEVTFTKVLKRVFKIKE